jgi:hypothetical protein
VNNLLPILLFGLGGILVGGAIAMRRQGAPTAFVVLLALMALMAVAAGALRVIYG